MKPQLKALLSTAAALALTAGAGAADQVIADDLIVQGSTCIGTDCVSGESFGFDTIRLKENNLRIKFDDTSASASFPNVDWQLTANDSDNGGANKFSVDDITNSRTPFTIEASAPSHSLYVDDGGRIGFGTSTPAVGLHDVEGNTPTLRMEQDGSSGWTPQIWDIAANETNFFVRDVTNSSNLAFRIKPGSGTGDALVIKGDGNIGLKTSNPSAALHLKRSDGRAMILVEETNATSSPRTLLNLTNTGRPEIVLANTITGGEWSFGAGTKFILKQGAVGSASSAKTKMLQIDELGNATFTGTVTTGGPTCSGGCDAVFDPDYALPSISEHAAQMFALGHLPTVGPTRPGQAFNMSEQYGRMLNELEKAHIYISELHQENTDQKAAIAALTERLDALESRSE